MTKKKKIEVNPVETEIRMYTTGGSYAVAQYEWWFSPRGGRLGVRIRTRYFPHTEKGLEHAKRIWYLWFEKAPAPKSYGLIGTGLV